MKVEPHELLYSYMFFKSKISSFISLGRFGSPGRRRRRRRWLVQAQLPCGLLQQAFLQAFLF